MINPGSHAGQSQGPDGARQVVRAESGFAYGVMGADIHVFGDGIPLYVLEEWRPAPQTDPGFLRELPSRMLNARFAVVDFTGREGELTELHQWRRSGPRLAARWLHAPGGQGKTRLAAQFAQESRAAGWKVVTATHGPGTVLPPPGSQDLRLDDADGLLLIIDYADRWPLTHLTWLFSNALLHRSAVPTRILMLARSAYGWPAVRGALANHQASTSAQPLPMLPDNDDGPGGRTEMFIAARDSFAARYGTQADGVDPPGTLGAPDFGLTLAVHMAALVAVDAHAAGRQPPQHDMAGLTLYLLDREHLQWEHLYGDAVHTLFPPASSYATPPSVMNQTVFTAALAGPLPHSTGTAVLETLALRMPSDRVVADHALCYPPTRDTVLEPLSPDRLAEDFLALSLPGHRAEYPAQRWAGPTTAAVLTRDGDEAAVPWTSRTLTYLAAAAERWPHVGPQHLFPLLRTDPQLAVDAGSSVLTALAGLTDIGPELLEAIEDRVPDYHSDLNLGMAAVTARLVEHRLAGAEDPRAQARIWHNLGQRLTAAALHEDAVAAAEEAVAIQRRIPKLPTEVDLGLASYLVSLTLPLSELGRTREALAAAEEALVMYRLAKEALSTTAFDADLFDAGLVRALHTLANQLLGSGRPTEAIAVAEESVELARRLPTDAAHRHQVQLGKTLSTLTACLTLAERRREALSAAEEALLISRQLAESDPYAHAHDLAAALENVASLYKDTGRPMDALSLAQEALPLRTRLAEINPTAYETDLASSLMNMANILAAIGRHTESLVTAEESVDIRRRLADRNQALHDPGLAKALRSLSARLLAVGELPQALAAAEEAVTVARRLTEGDRAAHEIDLAPSLIDMSNCLSAVGRVPDALAAAEEAADVNRRLAEADPSIHEPHLAAALSTVGNGLSQLGRHEEAAHAAEEATAIRRRLAIRDPQSFEPSFALSVHNLGDSLADAGRHEEAVRCTAEAVTIRRRLAEAEPEAYQGYLASSLTNLGSMMSDLGRHEEAVRCTAEAVTIRRRLAEAEPEAHAPGLLRSLSNFANQLREVSKLDEALAAAESATMLYQPLAVRFPDAHASKLAAVLHNLGDSLASAGRYEEAAGATAQAAVIRMNLAETDLLSFGPSLSTSLHVLGDYRRQQNRWPEACACYQEAVDVRRRLAEISPSDYEHLLPYSLHDLGAALAVAGSPDQGRAAVGEAVSIRRRLARSDPQQHARDLAFSLVCLGGILGAMDRVSEAWAVAEEALLIRDRFPGSSPDYFEPDLARLLSTLGFNLARMHPGERELSVRITQSAVDMYRLMADHDPSTHREGLALTLHDLGSRLFEVGRPRDAAAAAEESVGLWRDLAAADPGFSRQLAAASRSLTAFRQQAVQRR